MVGEARRADMIGAEEAARYRNALLFCMVPSFGGVGPCGLVGAERHEPSALMVEDILAGSRQSIVGFCLGLLCCGDGCLDSEKNQG
jgi:hypothetical protein